MVGHWDRGKLSLVVTSNLAWVIWTNRNELRHWEIDVAKRAGRVGFRSDRVNRVACQVRSRAGLSLPVFFKQVFFFFLKYMQYINCF